MLSWDQFNGIVLWYNASIYGLKKSGYRGVLLSNIYIYIYPFSLNWITTFYRIDTWCPDFSLDATERWCPSSPLTSLQTIWQKLCSGAPITAQLDIDTSNLMIRYPATSNGAILAGYWGTALITGQNFGHTPGVAGYWDINVSLLFLLLLGLPHR